MVTKNYRVFTNKCMALLCCTLTLSCLCSTVLSIRCVGRCVRYTCWQTRSLCVRLSGSGCLTPPVSLVWRQVREGTPLPVPSEPKPMTFAVATATDGGNPDVCTVCRQQSPEDTHTHTCLAPVNWSLHYQLEVWTQTQFNLLF